MALPKAICLLLCTIGYQVSVVGHGVVPNTWEAVVGKQAVKPSPVVTLASILCNGLAWVALASTSASWYLASGQSSVWLKRFCPFPIEGKAIQELATSEDMSLTFLSGVLLCLVGATVKIMAQRSLGILYNSSLNLRPAHRLVADGPYAFVRHPGYSGAMLSVVGLAIAHSSNPSYMSACGIVRSGYARAVWTWVIWSGAWCISLVVRATKEDEVLAGRFGVEYKHWSWNISKRFIPWIV